MANGTVSLSSQLSCIKFSLLPARVGACRDHTGAWVSRAEPAVPIVALNLVTMNNNHSE